MQCPCDCIGKQHIDRQFYLSTSLLAEVAGPFEVASLSGIEARPMEFVLSFRHAEDTDP